MPIPRRPVAGALVVLAAASMFALLGPLSRLAYERGMEPLSFVAWRAAIGTALLAAIVLATSRRRGARPRRPAGRRAAAYLVAATAAALVLNLAIFAALSRVTVALALLCFYTYPAMVAAVAFGLGRERPTIVKVAALGASLAGMVLVVAGGLDPAAGVVVDTLGVLLALGAAASQTVFVTISRDGYRSVPADRAMTVILAGTLVGCVALALASGRAASLAFPIGDAGVAPVLVLAGTVGAAIPSLLFLVGIRRVGGTRAGILMLFEPVVAVALAAVLLDEAVGPVQVAGGAAILAAALVLQRAPDRPVAARLSGGP